MCRLVLVGRAPAFDAVQRFDPSARLLALMNLLDCPVERERRIVAVAGIQGDVEDVVRGFRGCAVERDRRVRGLDEPVLDRAVQRQRAGPALGTKFATGLEQQGAAQSRRAGLVDRVHAVADEKLDHPDHHRYDR
jgi:hypothetical protein